MKIRRKPFGIGLMILIISFMALFPVSIALADTSEGGVSVSTTPQPTQMFIYDSGSWDEANSLTPADEMYINFTIDDADGGSNLDWVRVSVFDQAKNTYDGTVNQTSLTHFFWEEDTGNWNMTEETGSSWAVNTGASANSTTTTTFVNFTLVFTPGTNAFEETTNQWRFNITAMDDDSLEGFNATVESDNWPSTTGGPCDFYQSLTIQTGSTYYNFTATSPGGAAVQIYQTDAGAGAYLVFNVTANGVWDVNVSVSDWARQGGGDSIDVDAAEYQRIDDGSEFTNGNQDIDPSWLNSTSFLRWDGSTLSYNNTLEDGETKNLYMELSVPAGTTGGFYTQTLTVIALNG